MFKGNYKSKNSNGTVYVYSKGDSMLFQGKLYEAARSTYLSPIQQSEAWNYKGVTEIYTSDNPPLNPVVGQIWNTNGRYYSYFYDGNSYTWVEI
jgi:predicted homoserine dehydrogenase-like protein